MCSCAHVGAVGSPTRTALVIVPVVLTMGVPVVQVVHMVLVDHLVATGPVEEVLTTELLRRVYRVPVVVERNGFGRPATVNGSQWDETSDRDLYC